MKKLTILFILIFWAHGSVLASPVEDALSARHFSMDEAQLVRLAGSEEELVAELIRLRKSSQYPGVVHKASRLLLTKCHLKPVMEEILSDFDSESRQGLAQMTLVNINSVPEAKDRELIRSKARSLSGYEPYLKSSN